MSSLLKPNDHLTLSNPTERSELLMSAALTIQAVMNEKQDSAEYLREAIRQHEKRAAQLEEKISRHEEKKTSIRV